MRNIQLTPAQEAALRSQVIDDTHPGAVLHDFQVVLDYIGDKGVKAGGKYNMLPIDAIPVLDERLHRPLRLDLQRPQLRSHPYLHGSQLLLRASGLGRVDGAGAKARLMIDPAILQVWQQLNLTERYFTLLEAFLLVARPEMVGEQGGYSVGFLPDCLHGGLYQLYPLALMNLFGLGPAVDPHMPLATWDPSGRNSTPFGGAMLDLLRGWYAKQRLTTLGDPSKDFGVLQPLFQPYFPQWQKNLVVEAPSQTREGIFVFKVSLGKVWRRIAMKADHTLDDLMTAILNAVDFSSDHLYEFTYRDPRGRTARAMHPYCQDGVPADTVELASLPLQLGDTMSVTYDFGDEWRFTVKLERIDPPGSIKKLPKVLEAKGEAPEQYPDWE